MLLPGESQGCGSLVGCRLWIHTESDTTDVTQQQQQQQHVLYYWNHSGVLNNLGKECEKQILLLSNYFQVLRKETKELAKS